MDLKINQLLTPLPYVLLLTAPHAKAVEAAEPETSIEAFGRGPSGPEGS